MKKVFSMKDLPNAYEKLENLKKRLVKANLLDVYPTDELIKELMKRDETEGQLRTNMSKYQEGYNAHWFSSYPSGKVFGDAFAEHVRDDVFTDLEDSKEARGTTEYDAVVELNGDVRIEQKAARAMTVKIDNEETYLDRARNQVCNERLVYGPWQQVKPRFFDYILGAVLYLDATDYFLVPTTSICNTRHGRDPNKIRLSKQHETTDMGFGQITPPKAPKFLIATDTEETPLRGVRLIDVLEQHAGV